MIKVGEHDMVEKDKLSVIICTKNRIEDTIKCIKSILIQTQLPDEIVIVDSSDTEELKFKLDSFRNSNGIAFNYIYAEANLTKARNIGIDNSIGDIIMFLDDDIILDKDYVKEILDVFNNDAEKRVGGVTGNIINIEKNENKSFINSAYSLFMNMLVIIFLLPRRNGDGKFLPSGHPTDASVTNQIAEVENLSGANLSFRREILNEFRFDEKSPYMEDVDIAYRVSRRYQNIYTPFAKLVHNIAPLGGYGYRPDRMKNEIEGYYHHFKKNLPQDFKHKIAFWWSMMGLFVMAMIGRNKDNLKGLTSGTLSIIRNNKKGR